MLISTNYPNISRFLAHENYQTGIGHDKKPNNENYCEQVGKTLGDFPQDGYHMGEKRNVT